MDFEELFKKVEILTKKMDGNPSIMALVGFLAEEVGEVAQCETTRLGLKRKKIDEPIRTECIDVIICALRIYFTDGGTVETLQDDFKLKSDKWQGKIKKYFGIEI